MEPAERPEKALEFFPLGRARPAPRLCVEQGKGSPRSRAPGADVCFGNGSRLPQTQQDVNSTVSIQLERAGEAAPAER